MKKKNIDYGFAPAIRSMLKMCKDKKKKSAIFTMENVGKFENCDIIIKVIPNKEPK